MSLNFENHLQEKNIRPTPLRTALFEIFFQAQSPLTVPAIQESLAKKNLQPNKTSLYRHIELFVKKQLLHKIMLNTGIVHYEYQTHHHHHFTCNNCHLIKCLTDKKLEQRIHEMADNLHQSGLKIAEHHFSFSGLCQKCSH